MYLSDCLGSNPNLRLLFIFSLTIPKNSKSHQPIEMMKNKKNCMRVGLFYLFLLTFLDNPNC